jgi:hypothetical protein
VDRSAEDEIAAKNLIDADAAADVMETHLALE